MVLVSGLQRALWALLIVVTMVTSAVMGWLGDTLWGALAYGPLAVATVVLYRWRPR